MVKHMRAMLLDTEGDLSIQFTEVLKDVFVRFSSQAQAAIAETASDGQETAANGNKANFSQDMILTEEELDRFTRAVNDGESMPKEQKDELREYFSVDTHGNLTVGFQSIDADYRADIHIHAVFRVLRNVSDANV